jgi:hypothetical protein
MKKLLLITLLSAFTMAAYSQANAKKEFDKLKWLNGSWKRTNSKAGQSGAETWAITSPDKLTGKGITMRGKDTAYVEKLSLIIKGNEIFYVADVPDNSKPVYFKLTQITADSFVCENPEHNFPKKIAYQLSGSHIKAVISGNGKSVDYLFEKN